MGRNRSAILNDIYSGKIDVACIALDEYFANKLDQEDKNQNAEIIEHLLNEYIGRKDCELFILERILKFGNQVFDLLKKINVSNLDESSKVLLTLSLMYAPDEEVNAGILLNYLRADGEYSGLVLEMMLDHNVAVQKTLDIVENKLDETVRLVDLKTNPDLQEKALSYFDILITNRRKLNDTTVTYAIKNIEGLNGRRLIRLIDEYKKYVLGRDCFMQ